MHALTAPFKFRTPGRLRLFLLVAPVLWVAAAFSSSAFAAVSPVAGVDVAVRKKPGAIRTAGPQTTDAAGRFSFRLREAGEYGLTLSYSRIVKAIGAKDRDFAANPAGYRVGLALAGRTADGKAFDRAGNAMAPDQAPEAFILERRGARPGGAGSDGAIVDAREVAVGEELLFTAPSAGCTLEGTLTYETGAPRAAAGSRSIGGLMVVVLIGGKPVADARTSPSGEFAFELPAGESSLDLSYSQIVRAAARANRDYAADPDAYQAELELSVEAPNGQTYDRTGKLQGLGAVPDKVVVSKANAGDIRIQAPARGGTVSGTLTYAALSRSGIAVAWGGPSAAPAFPATEVALSRDSGGGVIAVVDTDANGKFVFDQLREGDYLLDFDYGALVEGLAVMDPKYAANPGGYDLKLVLNGIRPNGEVLDRRAVPLAQGAAPEAVVLTKSNSADMKFKAPKGGAGVSGTLSYAPKSAAAAAPAPAKPGISIGGFTIR